MKSVTWCVWGGEAWRGLFTRCSPLALCTQEDSVYVWIFGIKERWNFFQLSLTFDLPVDILLLPPRGMGIRTASSQKMPSHSSQSRAQLHIFLAVSERRWRAVRQLWGITTATTSTNNNNKDSYGSQTSNYLLTTHSQILTVRAVLPAHKLKTPFYSTQINNAEFIKAAEFCRAEAVPSAAAEHQPKALSSLHGKYSVKH